jgi:hypothetical protein
MIIRMTTAISMIAEAIDNIIIDDIFDGFSH